MPAFTQFTSSAPVTEETVARHTGRVPDGVLDAWRDHGAGLIGDGYVRLLDPDHARAMLNGVVALNDAAVPVFATALADVVVYIEPAFHLLRFRRNRIDFLGFDDTDKLFADLEDATFLDTVLERQPYPAAVERLGTPSIDECFFYVPLLALGGPEDPAQLQRGGLWEHLAVSVQMTGPPQPADQG